MKLIQIGLVVTCASALCFSQVFASTDASNAHFVKGTDLLPNNQEVKTYNGGLLHTKTFKCRVRTEVGNTDGSILNILAIKKRTIVNGVLLDEGASTSMTVHTGDLLTLEVQKRGQAGLRNYSKQLVNLLCK